MSGEGDKPAGAPPPPDGSTEATQPLPALRHAELAQQAVQPSAPGEVTVPLAQRPRPPLGGEPTQPIRLPKELGGPLDPPTPLPKPPGEPTVLLPTVGRPEEAGRNAANDPTLILPQAAPPPAPDAPPQNMVMIVAAVVGGLVGAVLIVSAIALVL